MLEFGTFDNVEKSRFKWCTSDQKAVNVLYLDQFVAVFVSNTTTVNYAAVGSFLVDAFEIWSDPVVDFVNLLGSGCFTSTDGPNGFVSKDDVVPVGDSVLDGVKLTLDDFDGLISFTFGQSFTETENNFQSEFKAIFDFFGNDGIGFTKMCSSLGMSQDDPLNVNILELFRSDFSSESTEGMHGAVLGGHIDVGLFLGE